MRWTEFCAHCFSAHGLSGAVNLAFLKKWPGQAFRVSTDLNPARHAAHSWYRILGLPGFGLGEEVTRTSGLPHSGQARTG